jgi:hypothetical protein
VLDTATGLEFHHVFTPNFDGTLIAQRIPREYPKVRARADYLLGRWRETVSSDLSVLYVRRDPFEEFTADHLVELRDVLRECHPSHRFALLWVRAEGTGDVSELADGVYVTAVPVAQPRTVRWQGEDPPWDRLYPKLQALPDSWKSAA